MELDNLGTVFEILLDGTQQQENVTPNRTLTILEKMFLPTRDGKNYSFEVLQKVVDSPNKWHRLKDGYFMAHTRAAVVLNESSPRTAFTALDSRGLPAAPVPSGRRSNCPLCEKEMRSKHIERHKKSASCVKRQQKN